MAYSDDSSHPSITVNRAPREPSVHIVHERRPREYVYISKAEKDITDEHRPSSLHRSRRRRSRKHVVGEEEPEADFQDSDDVLGEYYGGGGSGDDAPDFDEFNVTPPLAPFPGPSYAFGPSQYQSRPFASVHMGSRMNSRPIRRRSDYILRPDQQSRARGLWTRAVKSPKSDERVSVKLRLVVTRHGERYKSRDIPYTKDSWDDSFFARRLKEEYRILKATKIGFQETIASYTKIYFVYFRQYHAYPSERRIGEKWDGSKLVPITQKDTDDAKVWFMYQLQKLSSWRSRMEGGGGGRGRRILRIWTRRLDKLVEPGAVIDIEVQETFDVRRICMGLLIAILVSLAVALAYGFAKDQDFSTGFSIASWIITAAGFFAAIVALFGSDSSTSLGARFSAPPQDNPYATYHEL